jgi:hypothetical protein
MSYKLLKPFTSKQRADFIVEYNHNKGLTIEETDKALYALEANEILQDGESMVNPDYEKQQEQKERERLDSLSMTRSDFFDGTIKAFGTDQDDLEKIISNVLTSLAIEEVEKKVALNNFRNALNFYRKHPLFTMLCGTEIALSDTMSLLFTSEIWDKFFDETNSGNTDAYKELLTAVKVKVEETKEETTEETKL